MTHPDWTAFLRQRGFVAGEAGAPGLAGGPAMDDSLLMDLSHLGTVTVAGEDAFAFLQGQFTNDLQEVTESRSQLSGYCTPKGRLLALFRILAHGPGYRLVAPTEILEPVVKRLRRYVLRAKVDLEITPEMVTVGLAGAAAQALIEQRFGAAPGPGGVAADGATAVTGVGEARWLLAGPVEAMTGLWEAFGERLPPADGRSWRRLEILDGLPQVFAPTVEKFVPQMVNLDLVGGVSFAKGCYPGQEIVARLRYLGKLKQRMLCARVENGSGIAPGDGIHTEERGEQRVGTVVDAQRAEGGAVLLATAPLARFTEGPLLTTPQGGEVLQQIPLPYAVPQGDEKS